MALSLEKRLSKLARKKTEQIHLDHKKQKYVRRKKYVAWYAAVIAVINLIAFLIWAGHVKETFIDFWLLLLISLPCGLILSMPIIWWNRVLGLFFALFLSIFSANIFQLINQTYANTLSTEIVKKPVISKKARYGRSGPSVEIRYNGKIESFGISEEEQPRANYITLTIKQGYFGYAFIDDYKITAE